MSLAEKMVCEIRGLPGGETEQTMSTRAAIAFNLLCAELIAIGIGAQEPLLILAVLGLSWIQSGYRVRRVLGARVRVFLGA